MLALRAPALAAIVGTRDIEQHSNWKKLMLLTLLYTCWISTLSALARPVWVGEPVSLPTTGRDILLAVDISGSMEREDMQLGGKLVNRLVAVKGVVGDFVLERNGDRLGWPSASPQTSCGLANPPRAVGNMDCDIYIKCREKKQAGTSLGRSVCGLQNVLENIRGQMDFLAGVINR